MKKFHKRMIQQQARYFDECVKATIKSDKKYWSKWFSEKFQTNVKDQMNYGINRRHAIRQAFASLNKNQKAKAIRTYKWNGNPPESKTTWCFKDMCMRVCMGY